jgi:hypothetical protein
VSTGPPETDRGLACVEKLSLSRSGFRTWRDDAADREAAPKRQAVSASQAPTLATRAETWQVEIGATAIKRQVGK